MKILWFPLALVLFSGCAPVGHEYKSSDGKFSYTLPDGWTVREFPGLEYQVAYGTGDGFTANINLVSEQFDGPLQIYVEGNKNTIHRMFPDFQLVGQGLFDTASGVKGFKLVGKVSQVGMPLEQAWYFLPGKGEYFVATASALAADFTAQEKAFDSCLKSFVVR